MISHLGAITVHMLTSVKYITKQERLLAVKSHSDVSYREEPADPGEEGREKDGGSGRERDGERPSSHRRQQTCR